MRAANAKNLSAGDEQDWREYAAMLYSMLPRVVAAELLAHMRPVFERQRAQQRDP